MGKKMSGKCRPSLRQKTLDNVRHSNLSETDKRCITAVFEQMQKIPTIDAEVVVRCGECERRNKSADLTDMVLCPWLNMPMRKTDFCSYGERKDGEG